MTPSVHAKFKWCFHLSACMVFWLAGCSPLQQSSLSSVQFHPTIAEQGVNKTRYEADRAQCEKQAKSLDQSMVSNVDQQFRSCLIQKGYVLLS